MLTIEEATSLLQAVKDDKLYYSSFGFTSPEGVP